MKKLAIGVCVAFTLCGCGNSQVHEVNKLKRPVMVVSANADGGVLLSGADGQLYLATHDTYLGAALKNLQRGDTLFPDRQPKK